MGGEVKVWQPVESSDQRLALFDRLAGEQCAMDLEREGQMLPAKMRQREGTGLLAEMSRPGPVPFPPGSALNVRFSTGGEDYFFRCSPSFSGTKVLLPYPDEVFKLQKRKDFRMAVPSTFDAFVTVGERTGSDTPVRARLLDLSSSGIGFEVPAGEIFRAGEEIAGTLTLGGRAPLAVSGTVRFVKAHGDVQQIGVEFDHDMVMESDALQTAIIFFRVDVFHHLREKQ